MGKNYAKKMGKKTPNYSCSYSLLFLWKLSHFHTESCHKVINIHLDTPTLLGSLKQSESAKFLSAGTQMKRTDRLIGRDE